MSDSESNSNVTIIDRKLEFLVKNHFITLLIVGLIGIFLRLYYFPTNVPLIEDALKYFLYATDTSILKHLPTTYLVGNNGWPIFLSMFFATFHFNNTIDYMNLQRLVTISLSSLTFLPVYFLCKNIFDKPYAILGAAIFAFEPHIIQNSLLGITEPLYILLTTSSVALFLNPNRKLVYASFAITGLASLVRAEGLFLLFPLFIMFVVRYRKENRIIIRSLFIISIFLVLVVPMAIFRTDIQGNDALTARIVSGKNMLSDTIHENKLSTYVYTLVTDSVKFTGWSLIPTFILLVPPGLFFIFKKRNQTNATIILCILSMMLPVLYSYSLAPDTRYVYPLFPLFCVLAIFTVKRFDIRFKKQNLFLVLIMCAILFSSVVFLEVKKYDYEHQREAFTIAKYIVNSTSGVNNYYPDDSYIKSAELPDKWPALQSTIHFGTSVIPTTGYNSLEDYIKFGKENGLTHLVVDNSKNRPQFLKELFDNDNVSYLTEIYDSSEHGYKYHVKIYSIDYSKLDLSTNSSR